MAHIVRFKIAGLLGRDKPIEVNLESDVNIFFGENGSGKTTLLRILDAALDLNEEVMLNLSVVRAEVDIYSLQADAVFTHTWDRASIRNAKAKYEHIMLRPDMSEMRVSDTTFTDVEIAGQKSVPRWIVTSKGKKDKVDSRAYSHEFLPTSRLYSTDGNFRSLSARGITEKQLDQAFAENLNKTWLVYYAKILSTVRTIQEEGLRAVLYHGLSQSKEGPTGPTLDPEKAYRNVKQFLNRQASGDARLLGSESSFAERYASEPALRRIVDNINNVEERIELAMSPIKSFTTTINNLFSRGKQLRTVEKGLEIALENGSYISPANLSSGEKQMLKILLTAMTSGPNSVIIDEPELSIHIDWQRKLVRIIHALNPRCQLILASHAPEVMAEIADKKICRI
jgi:energy-coupling factor transporter ATP-binding protein EcfA2